MPEHTPRPSDAELDAELIKALRADVHKWEHEAALRGSELTSSELKYHRYRHAVVSDASARAAMGFMIACGVAFKEGDAAHLAIVAEALNVAANAAEARMAAT